MRGLRHLSIRRKLTLIMMLTSVVALLMACGAFVGYELVTFRQTLTSDLATLGDVIAANSTAALTFKDPNAAKDALSALRAQRRVVSACIYAKRGAPFATYARDGEGDSELPTTAARAEVAREKQFLSVCRPVMLEGERIGSVYIRSDLEEMHARVRRYAVIVGVVLATASLVALLLASFLQRLISGPVLRLAHTTRQVTAERDYSVRASRDADDELGVLIDGFNEMLAEIQKRDGQLREHQEHLESQVAARTVELTNANTNLTEARDRAMDASRAKSEFLANMSHEIRTPLNGVIGMTELALETELNPEQQDYLQTARASADTLLSVINDILDFSKIEAGKLDLDHTPMRLRDALETTLKTVALRAHAKGLELLCDVRPEVPDALIGDPFRIRQVLVNLTGNAIKFTEHGEILLRVEVEEARHGDAMLHFSVSDTGIGIPREKLDSIFESFTQADNSTTRRYGGSGLGLSISRRLVEMMGGRIWVESEIGHGTVFHFTARLAVQDGSHSDLERLPIELAGRRVLVVDDNATNRRILTEQLAGWGMKPQAMGSGAAALMELERAISTNRPYALILLDYHMPDMDGFTLAERILATPALARSHVMMLTSGGQTGDAARCRELGISSYLNKPVSQRVLLQSITRVLGGPDRTEDASPVVDEKESSDMANPSFQAAGGDGRRPLRVLLAEDNYVNQKLATTMLEKRGHHVTVASDGIHALRALDLEHFDVVLMDVHMPNMGGLEATAEIRRSENASGGHLPIVALTALAMKGDREMCLQAGMDAYVTKPISAAELFGALDKLFPNRAGSLGARVPATSVARPRTEIIDQDKLNENMEGDTEMLREIVEAFLRDQPEQHRTIAQALKTGDSGSLARAAHTFKGLLLTLAARPAAESALRLEMLARSGNLAGAADALQDLNREMDRLNPALDELLRRRAA